MPLIQKLLQKQNNQTFKFILYNITLTCQTAKYYFDILPPKTESLVWKFIFHDSLTNLEVVRRFSID